MRKPFSRAFTQPESAGLPVQVAAVCYRVRGASVEFLLVNTSSGKWTFPKGRIDPFLSASESAAREAMEEAGAVGRIEPVHFGSYLDSKRVPGEEGARELLIAAYMFEVRARVAPEEGDRNPTWFTAQETKKRLSERRSPRQSAQLEYLVDEAVRRAGSRVRRSLSPTMRTRRLQIVR